MIEHGAWCLQNGRGFDLFEPAINRIVDQVSAANQQLRPHNKQLDLHLIDSCFPDQYQNQNKKLLVTNNWIDPRALDSSRYESLSPAFYGIYHGNPGLDDCEPTQAFNCLIKRMDTIRQTWLYQLVRRELLDQGHVSFMMDVSRHYMNGEAHESDSAHDVFQRQFETHCEIFKAEHEFIKNQLPYRSFDNDWSLDQVVMHSRFSIILETYFIDPRMITLSEKTFRCLKLPRPWIVFSTKGTVQYLRDLGFDVLDDVVDHSYDSIDFGIDRQVRLLDLAQEMTAWPFTAKLLDRCKQAANHNQQLLAHWYENLDRDMGAAIDRAVKKCLNL